METCWSITGILAFVALIALLSRMIFRMPSSHIDGTYLQTIDKWILDRKYGLVESYYREAIRWCRDNDRTGTVGQSIGLVEAMASQAFASAQDPFITESGLIFTRSQDFAKYIKAMNAIVLVQKVKSGGLSDFVAEMPRRGNMG